MICGNDKILKQVKEGQTNPNRCERAFLLGKDLGKKAKELGTIGFILDRKWYKYHGVLKSFVDGFRHYCVI